jgi:hypothetical protein
VPLRLRHEPTKRSIYAGHAIIIDFNVTDEFTGSAQLLQEFDRIGVRPWARLMSEHIRAMDGEGHMACGFQCIMLEMLRMNAIGLRGGNELELYGVFKQLCMSDLQMHHVIDVNTSMFRNICERRITENSGDRSTATLLRALNSYPLTMFSEIKGTNHGVITLAMSEALIMDVVRNHNANQGLHVAIVKYTGGAQPDAKIHHFFAAWYIDDEVLVD